MRLSHGRLFYSKLSCGRLSFGILGGYPTRDHAVGGYEFLSWEDPHQPLVRLAVLCVEPSLHKPTASRSTVFRRYVRTHEHCSSGSILSSGQDTSVSNLLQSDV